MTPYIKSTILHLRASEQGSSVPVTGKPCLGEEFAYPRRDPGVITNEKTDPMTWASRLRTSDHPPHYDSVCADKPPDYSEKDDLIWFITAERASKERIEFLRKAKLQVVHMRSHLA